MSSRHLLLAVLSQGLHAQQLSPDGSWMAYADVRQAGYDTDLLDQAEAAWAASDSAAWLVIDNGAVVAAWGDVERR
jgi:hypothetical protein